jgi:hypothetical protein
MVSNTTIINQLSQDENLIKCTNCSRHPQPIDQFLNVKNGTRYYNNSLIVRCLKCRTKNNKQKTRCDLKFTHKLVCLVNCAKIENIRW